MENPVISSQSGVHDVLDDINWCEEDLGAFEDLF